MPLAIVKSELLPPGNHLLLMAYSSCSPRVYASRAYNTSTWSRTRFADQRELKEGHGLSRLSIAAVEVLPCDHPHRHTTGVRGRIPLLSHWGHPSPSLSIRLPLILGPRDSPSRVASASSRGADGYRINRVKTLRLDAELTAKSPKFDPRSLPSMADISCAPARARIVQGHASEPCRWCESQ